MAANAEQVAALFKSGTSSDLKGKLYLSQSGFLLLSVPNAIGRGAFDALREPGVELPTTDGRYNAHITVMRPDEIRELGGPNKLTERGHEFSFTLGKIRDFNPIGWTEMSRCWVIEVKSPELKKLRTSYGLPPLPVHPKNGQAMDFHITFAVRRNGVLSENAKSKAPPVKDLVTNWDKPGTQIVKASDFRPDFTPQQLREMGVYEEMYGANPEQRLASMTDWPERWFNPQDPKGWLQWYERYAGGRRSDDDLRQIKRWKSFKARHGAQFKQNPTPRRAFALQHWAVDALAMLPPDQREQVRQAMEAYKAKHVAKYASIACPACGGMLVEIHGHLQCSQCGRICESCCEGSEKRAVYKLPVEEYAAFEEQFPDVAEQRGKRPLEDQTIYAVQGDKPGEYGGGIVSGRELNEYNRKRYEEHGHSPEDIISWFYLRDALRGQGLGRELLAQAIGDNAVGLSTDNAGRYTNEAAKALYKKLGFEPFLKEDASTYWFRPRPVEKQAVTLGQTVARAARRALAPKSDAQAEAGNYRKGHVNMHGLQITIENPKGSVRSGTSKDGKAWSVTMPHHYGYIRRTTDLDGDHVDVFIGPDPHSEIVYVVDQIDPVNKKFDEHKCLVGFTTLKDAKAGYLASYEDGWKGLGKITPVTMQQFKAWLKDGTQTRPISTQTFRMKKAEEDKEEDEDDAPPILVLRRSTTIQMVVPDEQPRDDDGKFESKYDLCQHFQDELERLLKNFEPSSQRV